MILCTCTVFARSGKMHDHNCPKRQAYEQQAQSSSERKAGKCGRIKAIVKMLRPKVSSVDEQLMVVLGMKKKNK
jgi:hypothetical protein